MSGMNELNLAGDPRISDVLADPIVQLLIERDGWTPDSVRAALAAAATHLDQGHRTRA